jgi:hypothetical protein
MRKIIFAFAIILTIAGNAQKPWEKLKMDSAKFSSIYGTEFQYKYQQQLMDKSSSKMLCLWTGAKPMYLYNFAMYLGAKYNVTWSPGGNDLIIKATPKISNTQNATPIKLTAKINDKDVVSSVIITGPVDDLIKIYAGYWELSAISFNEVKTKKQITMDFVSDKISIKWSGSNLIITVTKNKGASMDIFPI